MNKQVEIHFMDRRHQAEQWRAKELIFAQGIINVMERLARKDASYIKMLQDFATKHEADSELVQMVQDALASLQYHNDQAINEAANDI